MSRTSSPTSSPTSPSTPPPRPLELYEMDLEELKSQLSKITKQQTKKRSWENLLEGSICIGEKHDDVAPKKFLIQNMPLFKDSGFTVLFMEHLSIKEHLNLLEEYFTKEEMEMSHELKTKLNHLDNGHELHSGGREKSKEWRNYNFTEIVKAAKHNGIKVIPLEESEDSWRRVNKREGGMREAVLSLNAKKVIDQHPGSKWLALVGSAHLNTYQDIPGICEIVQDAQDLLITDFNINLEKDGTGHSQSLEVHLALTDIKWTAEKSSPSTDVKSTAEKSSPSTDVKSTAEDSSPKNCIKASISLIIDYRSEMSYGAISANESLRPTAQNISSSSSSSAAAEENPKGKRGQEQRTETGGVSLLRKKPATKMTMPAETTENESQKIRKLSEQGSGENKGRE